MAERKAYPENRNRGIAAFNHEAICKFILAVSFLIFLPSYAVAQEEPSYDEIAVYLKIPYFGVGEIEAVIRNEELYLPVTTLFDFLKIRNVPSENLDLVTGFFIAPEAEYSIDRAENIIIYARQDLQAAGGRPGQVREQSLPEVFMVRYGLRAGLQFQIP